MKTFHVIWNGIVLEYQPEPEGGYTVTVPMLPGCVTYGDTFENAMEMAKDAISAWVAVAKEDGIPIPEPVEALAASG
jgi:predicted RNase H-like HicB family nuclease